MSSTTTTTVAENFLPDRLRPCRAFSHHGTCIMGNQCRFKHGNDFAPASATIAEKTIDHSKTACRYYGLKGGCILGEKCTLMHSDNVAKVNRSLHCRAYKLSGGKMCPQGDACIFSHNLTAPQLCRQYFIYDNCPFGADKCGFAHDENQKIAETAVTTESTTTITTTPKEIPMKRSQPCKLFVVMRHGERIDNHEDQESVLERSGGENKGEDPSLTKRGYNKAKDEVAQTFLASCRDLLENRIRVPDIMDNNTILIKIHVSPFLRCLQTVAALLEGFIGQTTSSSASPNLIQCTSIIIDNTFCELFNPQTIKQCKNQVNGPNLLSFDEARELLLKPFSVNNNKNSAKPNIELSQTSLPRFGESREAGYDRIRRGLVQTMVNSNNNNSNNNSDITLVVTHGDALNACMLQLKGPSTVVYACEYLGYYFVEKKDGSGNQTEVLSANGVEWFEE